MKIAEFHIDLLQIIACLKEDDGNAISKVFSTRYGHKPNVEGQRTIIGIDNALGFIDEIYKTEKVISENALPHYKINPLIKLLEIKCEKYLEIDLPTISLKAVPEGTTISNKTPYLELTSSYLVMAKTLLSMDRIIEFQSHINEQLQPYQKLRKKYKEMGMGEPTFINEGSHITYSTTLSAYDARAKFLAGLERFYDHDLRNKDNEQLNKINRPFWEISSNFLINEINCKINNELFEKNFGEDAAKLKKDGIFYLREEQLLGNNSISFALNGSSINNIYIDGSIDGILNKSNKETNSDFLIDSKYQNIYGIKRIIGSAIYGQKGKSTLSFKSKTGINKRADRNSIAVFECSDQGQLEDLIFKVKTENKDKEIYYRGQTNHYDLQRSELTNKLLYGNSDIEEVSMPTAASREDFNFDSFSAIFQMQLQGIIYSSITKNKFEDLESSWPFWGSFSPYTDPNICDVHEKFKRLYYSYEWDLMTMGIAQHYGIPTHGLDITSDIKVALWFAENKWYSYEEDGKKYAWYKKLETNPKEKIKNYPVVYIIGTKSNLKKDLDQIEYIDLKATRPVRQKAYLHYGGFGLHSNICAKDILAIVRLTPDFPYPKEFTTEYLFPNIIDDPLYSALLKLKEDAIKEGLIDGYSRITHYKKEKSSL